MKSFFLSLAIVLSGFSFSAHAQNTVKPEYKLIGHEVSDSRQVLSEVSFKEVPNSRSIVADKDGQTNLRFLAQATHVEKSAPSNVMQNIQFLTVNLYQDQKSALVTVQFAGPENEELRFADGKLDCSADENNTLSCAGTLNNRANFKLLLK